MKKTQKFHRETMQNDQRDVTVKHTEKKTRLGNGAKFSESEIKIDNFTEIIVFI